MFFSRSYYTHVLLIILFGILPFTAIQAQHWTSANGAVTTNKLNEVELVSAQTVYAVGDVGTILKSTDGGENWSDVSYETTRDLLSLYFFDEQNGFVGGPFSTGGGGSSEMLAYTDNGAGSWDVRSSFDFDNFNDMEFIDNQNGWAASKDGTVLYTTDGGDNWSNTQAGSETLLDFHIINNSHFWIAGENGALYQSADSGQNWQSAIQLDTIAVGESIYGTTQFLSSTDHLYDVEFTDEQTGYVIGETYNSGSVGFLLKTTDGGDNWKHLDFDPQHIFYDLEINDNGVLAIAAGSDDFKETKTNAVYISEDDGATWKVISDGNGPLFWNDLDTHNNNWIAAGESGATTTFSTADDTLHSNLKTGHNITDIDFENETNAAFVTGDRVNGAIYITSDGGQNWTKTLELPERKDFTAVTYSSQNTIWAIGNDHFTGGAVWLIYHSTDGGQNWTKVDPGFTDYEQNKDLEDIQFVTSQTGFIKAGDKLLKTTDSGTNWTELSEPSSHSFSSFDNIHFTSAQNGWMAGDDVIVKTTDGGNSWSISYEQSNSQAEITNIQFLNASTGYVTIKHGDMMKTQDGGTTWEDINLSTSYDLLNLNFISPDSGYVVGRGGRILSTVDGGEHFNKNYSVTSKDLYSIHIINQNQAWITGEKGALLTTSAGGGLFTSTEETSKTVLPQTISLKQNYPNPFNPTTTIHYHLPKAENVMVKVFNLMGQHVATLVNQKQQAGEHQVTFNAKNLASGMYFYQINTAQFSQTKKMMLIK